MKKYILPFFSAILIGVLLGYFMINQYDGKQNVKLVFNSGENISFFQYGVYSSLKSMEENTKNLKYYTYEKKDDKYYVYVAITKKNTDKLKGYFKELGYNIYVKEIKINNQAFLSFLEECDTVIAGVEKNEAITSVVNEILRKYEELEGEHKN